MTATTNLVDSNDLDWPGVQQLIRLERHTTVAGNTRTWTTYAITSLSRTQANAKQLLRLLRGRWEIENRCFHMADTTFKQDHHRTRTGHAAQTLANLDYLATNLWTFPRLVGATLGLCGLGELGWGLVVQC